MGPQPVPAFKISYVQNTRLLTCVAGVASKGSELAGRAYASTRGTDHVITPCSNASSKASHCASHKCKQAARWLQQQATGAHEHAKQSTGRTIILPASDGFPYHSCSRQLRTHNIAESWQYCDGVLLLQTCNSWIQQRRASA